MFASYDRHVRNYAKTALLTSKLEKSKSLGSPLSPKQKSVEPGNELGLHLSFQCVS